MILVCPQPTQIHHDYVSESNARWMTRFIAVLIPRPKAPDWNEILVPFRFRFVHLFIANLPLEETLCVSIVEWLCCEPLMDIGMSLIGFVGFQH